METKNRNSDSNSKPKKPTNSNKLPNFKPPTNGDRKRILLNLVTLTLIFVAIVVAVTLSQNTNTQETEEPKQFSDLITAIRNEEVSKLSLSPDKKTISAEIYKDTSNPSRDNVDVETFPNISETNSSVLENLKNAVGEDDLKIGSADGEIEYVEQQRPLYQEFLLNGTFWYIATIIVVFAVVLFIIRRASDTNNRAISFGDSRARVFGEDGSTEKVTFSQVAGNEEAKQELLEAVDFLKNPEEYRKMGAKIPKGVLLVGTPGNGKTLMAKAVAGEAGVPFFYVSGSEFVEMFVGVGASRVRSLFTKAKKKSPCVIFIDEIDAVGRQRGAGLGGGNDEREQTLNQILVEMDGFEPSAAVIVIGATNRPDVLDPALLRPGRFDRQVTVTAPDMRERLKILEVHAENKKLAPDADLAIIAKRTPGFSGADLMNVLNEAAILAVRERRADVNNDCLREAVEKVALGSSLKSKYITPEQKKLTAYHEAGHALIATVLENAQKVQKITIIPRGRAAGYTFHAESENDAITKTKSQFLDEIKVLFGGYTVEQEIFGDLSTGASNDLSKATEIARNMTKKYGMSSLGPVSYNEDHGLTFLGKDMVEKQLYSEEMGSRIDKEVSTILDKCYQECRDLVRKYKKYLVKIAEKLIEQEVLEFEEFNEIVKDIVVNKKTLKPKSVLA